MSWDLAEGCINAIKAALESLLPAKLTALNAVYGDTDLVNPVAYFVTENDLDEVAQTPIVVILADESTGEGFRSTLTIETFVGARIIVLVEDDRYEFLRRRVYRFGRAIFEVITDAKRAGSLGGWQPVGQWRLDYTPLITNEARSKFVQGMTLEWTYEKQEDR